MSSVRRAHASLRNVAGVRAGRVVMRHWRTHLMRVVSPLHQVRGQGDGSARGYGHGRARRGGHLHRLSRLSRDARWRRLRRLRPRLLALVLVLLRRLLLLRHVRLLGIWLLQLRLLHWRRRQLVVDRLEGRRVVDGLLRGYHMIEHMLGRHVLARVLGEVGASALGRHPLASLHRLQKSGQGAC